MRLRYNELKTVQAVAWLLKLNGGKDNYTRVLKMLYLADRQSLVETGMTMTGDVFVNMKHGPVLSHTLDLIKTKSKSPIWNAHVGGRTGFEISLLEDPGDSELSDYDVEVLEAIFNQHRNEDFRRIIDFVHTLPEWVDPGSSTLPLKPEDVLRKAGVDETTIADFVATNDSVMFVRSLAVAGCGN